jgi:predicted DNA-binding protein
MELVKSNGIKLEATSLSLTKRMDLDEGAKFVLGLDSMESGVSYWIGDCLNALEALHGEAYAQVIPDGKAHSWAVYKWTCSRVKPETRRATLSFTHHMAVASLLHERQEIYLKRAEDEQLSVSALKKLVKGEKGKETKIKLMTCPKCGESFEVKE